MQESISFSLKFIQVITFGFKGVPMAKAKCKTTKCHFGFCNPHPESRLGRRIGKSRDALTLTLIPLLSFLCPRILQKKKQNSSVQQERANLYKMQTKKKTIYLKFHQALNKL